jgi:hypothetical protein
MLLMAKSMMKSGMLIRNHESKEKKLGLQTWRSNPIQVAFSPYPGRQHCPNPTLPS